MTMSVDGYVVGPVGMSTGGFPERQSSSGGSSIASVALAHIMDRVSYEEMGPYWQKSADAYAAPMNDIPKVVFSKTLKEATWPESTKGDLHEEIAKLKKQPGGEIIAWGGAVFAQALSKAGLMSISS
nr:hypothetical protein [Mesorhizobium sp. CA5]